MKNKNSPHKSCAGRSRPTSKIGFAWAVLIPALGLLACETYGKIQVTPDTFQKATVVTVKILHTSEEPVTQFGASRLIDAIYVKKRETGRLWPIEMKVIFDAPETAELRPLAFVEVEGQKTELTVQGINRTTNVVQHLDLIVMVERYTVTKYKAYGTVTFPPALWQQIVKAKNITYRFYIDQTPYTIRLSEAETNKLRNFDGH